MTFGFDESGLKEAAQMIPREVLDRVMTRFQLTSIYSSLGWFQRRTITPEKLAEIADMINDAAGVYESMVRDVDRALTKRDGSIRSISKGRK